MMKMLAFTSSLLIALVSYAGPAFGGVDPAFQSYKPAPGSYPLGGNGSATVTARCIDEDLPAASAGDRFKGAEGISIRHTVTGQPPKDTPLAQAIAEGQVEAVGTDDAVAVRVRLLKPAAGKWEVIVQPRAILSETPEIATSALKRLDAPGLRALYDRTDRGWQQMRDAFPEGSVLSDLNDAIIDAGWEIQSENINDEKLGVEHYNRIIDEVFGGATSRQEMALYLGIEITDAQSKALTASLGRELADDPKAVKGLALLERDFFGATLKLPGKAPLDIKDLSPDEVAKRLKGVARLCVIGPVDLTTVDIAAKAGVPLIQDWHSRIKWRRNGCNPKLILALPKTPELAASMIPKMNPYDAARMTERWRKICEKIGVEIASSKDELEKMLKASVTKGESPIVVAENLRNAGSIGFDVPMSFGSIRELGGELLACRTFVGKGSRVVTADELAFDSIEAGLKAVCGGNKLPPCDDFWGQMAEEIVSEVSKTKRRKAVMIAGAIGGAGISGYIIFGPDEEDGQAKSDEKKQDMP